MHLRRPLELLRWAAVLALLAAQAGGAADLPRVRIGVVGDGDWPMNPLIRELTVREVRALTDGEFDVEFPAESYLIGDWSLGTARANLHRLLDDPEVDLVIAWGLMASQAACCLGELPKPVIAPVVIDPTLQGLPSAGGASGRHNLNYVALPDTLAEELETYREVVPFHHIAILTHAPLLEAVPELPERTARAFAGSGVEFDYIAARTSADEVLEAISPDADAVYVWPLFQFSAGEYRRLIDGFIARRLPSFSSLGGGDVEAGMLASAGAPDFFPKLARRIALNVQRILLGEEPGDLPVEFALRRRLRINMATARAIDVSPRWEVLIEADVLHAEDVEGADRLSLETAVREAVELNLDLLAARRGVAAGEQEVERARAALRPQAELSGSEVVLDPDRAAASFGSQAERTLSAGASLTQVLFSEPATAGVEIERQRQSARERDLARLELDVALDAGRTYIDLLRARALERVQHNNVDRTRSNLEVSELRREIGVASAGEVLRWESELASARKALVEAVADRRSAEIAVNRLLHRRLDAPFIAADVELDGRGVLTGLSRFRRTIETPKGYQAFADFVVVEGLRRAPELARLDAAIRAQDRFRLSSRRAFWAPAVGLQASFEQRLAQDGPGGATLLEDLPFEIPVVDDSSWSLGLQASLPLFAGGARAARLSAAELELERLTLERAAVGEKLEQRMRVALEQARASLAGIALADRAAEAARGNLALVNDAYARGAASLLDLLDAQTAALNSEEGAARALYDFLVDWLEAKRSAAALDPLVDEGEHAAWVARLDAYLARRGVVVEAGAAEEGEP